MIWKMKRKKETDMEKKTRGSVHTLIHRRTHTVVGIKRRYYDRFEKKNEKRKRQHKKNNYVRIVNAHIV